jgi:hypothetical protein
MSTPAHTALPTTSHERDRPAVLRLVRRETGQTAQTLAVRCVLQGQRTTAGAGTGGASTGVCSSVPCTAPACPNIASMPPGDVSAPSTPSTMHPGPRRPSGDSQIAALAERRWSTKMPLSLPLPPLLLTSLPLPLPTYLHSTYPLPTSSCCARPAMPLLLAYTAAIARPRTSHPRACAARARHGRGSLAQRNSLASLAPECRPPPGAALHRACAPRLDVVEPLGVCGLGFAVHCTVAARALCTAAVGLVRARSLACPSRYDASRRCVA